MKQNMADTEKCERCDGCGQIANSEDGEPWTMWTALPPQSQVAMRLGLVCPITCPSCEGKGVQDVDGIGVTR